MVPYDYYTATNGTRISSYAGYETVIVYNSDSTSGTDRIVYLRPRWNDWTEYYHTIPEPINIDDIIQRHIHQWEIDPPAKRYFVSLYWDGKRNKIWRYNGEPIWHEKTANKLLSKIRAEIDDGCFLLKSYLPDSPISLGQYSKQWLKALSVSPATLKFYTKAIQHAVDYFGEAQDIRKFSFSKLQIFYNELPLTIKGKYHVLNTIKTMLKFAYHDEIIKRMPPTYPNYSSY